MNGAQDKKKNEWVDPLIRMNRLNEYLSEPPQPLMVLKSFYDFMKAFIILL